LRELRARPEGHGALQANRRWGRLVPAVIRRCRRFPLISSLAALFALLPIAHSASKEPQKELGDGEGRALCAPDLLRERQLRDFLAQLESTLVDLRKKYTEEHPRIRVVGARIAQITLSLNAPECPRFRLLAVEA
jgi:hypothetical protein